MTLAGFFGLFDYNKPGPGVDKNGPKKKGFVIFFEIYFRKFWKLCTANLLYVLVSLPLVTGGLADAGLTYITRNFAREKHAFIAGDFFDTIKKNWKQALPIGIINLVLTALLVFDLYFFGAPLFIAPEEGAEGPGIMNYVMFALICSIGIVFTFAKYYMSMMLITFKLSIKQIYKNAFIFAFVGLKRNLLISLVQIICFALGFLLLFIHLYIGITVLLLLYIFWYPAFRSYLIQYNIFPLIKKNMIDPYYKEHPEEGKQERKALNIEEEEPDLEDDEPVFQDMGRTDKEEEEEKKPLNIPRQYSEQEMRRINKRIRQTRQGSADDDDDTI